MRLSLAASLLASSAIPSWTHVVNEGRGSQDTVVSRNSEARGPRVVQKGLKLQRAGRILKRYKERIKSRREDKLNQDYSVDRKLKKVECDPSKELEADVGILCGSGFYCRESLDSVTGGYCIPKDSDPGSDNFILADERARRRLNLADLFELGDVPNYQACYDPRTIQYNCDCTNYDPTYLRGEISCYYKVCIVDELECSYDICPTDNPDICEGKQCLNTSILYSKQENQNTYEYCYSDGISEVCAVLGYDISTGIDYYGCNFRFNGTEYCCDASYDFDDATEDYFNDYVADESGYSSGEGFSVTTSACNFKSCEGSPFQGDICDVFPVCQFNESYFGNETFSSEDFYEDSNGIPDSDDIGDYDGGGGSDDGSDSTSDVDSSENSDSSAPSQLPLPPPQDLVPIPIAQEANICDGTDQTTDCGTVGASSGLWYSLTGSGSVLELSASCVLAANNVTVTILDGSCGNFTCLDQQLLAPPDSCGTEIQIRRRLQQNGTVAVNTEQGTSYFVLLQGIDLAQLGESFVPVIEVVDTGVSLPPGLPSPATQSPTQSPAQSPPTPPPPTPPPPTPPPPNSTQTPTPSTPAPESAARSSFRNTVIGTSLALLVSMVLDHSA